MKVLLLNGSPHADGNTAVAINEMVKVFAACVSPGTVLNDTFLLLKTVPKRNICNKQLMIKAAVNMVKIVLTAALLFVMLNKVAVNR